MSDQIRIGGMSLRLSQVESISVGYQSSVALWIAFICAFASAFGLSFGPLLWIVSGAAIATEIVRASRLNTEVRIHYITGRCVALPCLSNDHARQTRDALMRLLPNTPRSKSLAA
jgi:hypothetical protein